MRNNGRVALWHMIVYYAAAAFGGYVGAMVSTWLLRGPFLEIFLSLAQKSIPLYNALTTAFVAVVAISVEVLVCYLAVSDLVPRQFGKGDTVKTKVFKAAVFMLPGELLKFILVAPTFGMGSVSAMYSIDASSGMRSGAEQFCIVPSSLYHLLYAKPFGRVVPKEGYTKEPQDYIVFGLIYLVYLAVHLGLLWLLYDRKWKKCKKRADEGY